MCYKNTSCSLKKRDVWSWLWPAPPAPVTEEVINRFLQKFGDCGDDF